MVPEAGLTRTGPIATDFKLSVSIPGSVCGVPGTLQFPGDYRQIVGKNVPDNGMVEKLADPATAKNIGLCD